MQIIVIIIDKATFVCVCVFFCKRLKMLYTIGRGEQESASEGDQGAKRKQIALSLKSFLLNFFDDDDDLTDKNSVDRRRRRAAKNSSSSTQ